MAVCVVLALVVSLRLTPIYESTATLDIDLRHPHRHRRPGTVQTSTNDADQFLATQVKLIESDSVLRPVAEKYRLLERAEETGDLDPEECSLLGIPHRAQAAEGQDARPTHYLLEISYRSRTANSRPTSPTPSPSPIYSTPTTSATKPPPAFRRFMEKQLEELKAKMERSSDALATMSAS